jgi:RNA polymerase sigma-70 factor (ECF subfamily)
VVLTLAFFFKLLQKNQIALADPERGRFRTFLLRSLENFLHNHHRDATALKRGGGLVLCSWDAQLAEERYDNEPWADATPAALFDREWAGTLLETVFTGLRREFSTNGRVELFDELEPHLWGEDHSTPHQTIAESLNMSVVSVRVTLHRLRQRFHERLREEIANTVESSADVDEELRFLRQVLTA